MKQELPQSTNALDSLIHSKKLLTSQEVAERLGLKNPRTLAVWRSVKRYSELAHVKVGRAVRYREEDVESFLRARTVGGAREDV